MGSPGGVARTFFDRFRKAWFSQAKNAPKTPYFSLKINPQMVVVLRFLNTFVFVETCQNCAAGSKVRKGAFLFIFQRAAPQFFKKKLRFLPL